MMDQDQGAAHFGQPQISRVTMERQLSIVAHLTRISRKSRSNTSWQMNNLLNHPALTKLVTQLARTIVM